jgi:uncharacterized protein (DUF2062 family)
MTGGGPRLPERLRAILQLDDPPQRIALALAVGVFIGCTPFWGLQTLLSVAAAVVFRLNRAATVTGTWLILPWFAPLIYGAALKIGSLVVPDPGGIRSAWLDYFLHHPGSFGWRDYLELFRELSAALLVGTTVIGAAAAAVAYVVALVAISSRRGAGDTARRDAV